jgi:hypothetical protein
LKKAISSYVPSPAFSCHVVQARRLNLLAEAAALGAKPILLVRLRRQFFANSYLAGFKEINELDSENTRKAHPAPRDTAARGRAASRRDANQFL